MVSFLEIARQSSSLGGSYSWVTVGPLEAALVGVLDTAALLPLFVTDDGAVVRSSAFPFAVVESSVVSSLLRPKYAPAPAAMRTTMQTIAIMIFRFLRFFCASSFASHSAISAACRWLSSSICATSGASKLPSTVVASSKFSTLEAFGD